MAVRVMGLFERQKGSGVWWISYCDRQGKRHRERVGRKAEAITAYSDRKREIREGRYVPPRTKGRALTFLDLSERAMEHKKLKLQPSSYITDMRHLEHLYPMLGHLQAAAIQPADVETILAKFRNRGLSGSTANRYRSLLSSIFRYAVRMRLIHSNPIAEVERSKESAHRDRYLKPEEEERLRKVIREKCPSREPELDLALYTGMRRGEQFSLKWENVDRKNRRLTVYGKSGRRYVTVNSSADAALEKLAWPQVGFESLYVCPETKSDTQKDWRRWFEDALKEAGIKNFRWHDLRHTFASRLVMAGVPLNSVKDFLGHHSLVMTERYAHLSPDHRAIEIEKIGAKC
jgi:site-specific recombinase XerD